MCLPFSNYLIVDSSERKIQVADTEYFWRQNPSSHLLQHNCPVTWTHEEGYAEGASRNLQVGVEGHYAILNLCKTTESTSEI